MFGQGDRWHGMGTEYGPHMDTDHSTFVRDDDPHMAVDNVCESYTDSSHRKCPTLPTDTSRIEPNLLHVWNYLILQRRH